MPLYTYRNKNTDEVTTEKMSISEMEIFEKSNPDLERVYGQMNIADSVNIGVTRPPVDFQKHVLGRVKAVPGANINTIEKRWTIPKEV